MQRNTRPHSAETEVSHAGIAPRKDFVRPSSGVSNLVFASKGRLRNGLHMSTTTSALGERPQRDKLKFAIELDARYQCARGTRISVVGIGKTLEISSREVQFTTQHLLKQGEKVRVALEWPVLLDNTCHMRLEICGPVIQSGPGTAAVKIVRWEFRTRGSPLRVMRSRLDGQQCVAWATYGALRVIN